MKVRHRAMWARGDYTDMVEPTHLGLIQLACAPRQYRGHTNCNTAEVFGRLLRERYDQLKCLGGV